jgi:hypothetical protein
MLVPLAEARSYRKPLILLLQTGFLDSPVSNRILNIMNTDQFTFYL